MVEKKKPTRTCVCCRKEMPKNELLRIVRNKDGEIFIDESGKANGRGAYICKDAECIKRFFKSKGLDRAFKTAVPKEVYDKLAEAIFER